MIHTFKIMTRSIYCRYREIDLLHKNFASSTGTVEQKKRISRCSHGEKKKKSAISLGVQCCITKVNTMSVVTRSDKASNLKQTSDREEGCHSEHKNAMLPIDELSIASSKDLDKVCVCIK